jgi:hypothetical protein
MISNFEIQTDTKSGIITEVKKKDLIGSEGANIHNVQWHINFSVIRDSRIANIILNRAAETIHILYTNKRKLQD